MQVPATGEELNWSPTAVHVTGV